MNISLVRLPDDGRRFEHEYADGEIDLSEDEFSIQSQPIVSGRVDRTGVDYRVRGHLKAQIAAPCDRCLADVVFPVDQPFDLFYTPPVAEGGNTGEKELQLKDLDFAFLEGEEINLDELVREQLSLSLPVRVLCREDCKGLCSECGVDRNQGSCECQPPLDPRWQALADIQGDLAKKRTH